MKFSENWLRSWINPKMNIQQLSHQLTMAGLEVDAIESVALPLSKVVVGVVNSVTRHPDADKLNICEVLVGNKEPLQIVCGAKNVEVGMKVPTALVGAKLTLPSGDILKIKKAKLRGIVSMGMLCSATEIGLEKSSEGLMSLPGDAKIGQNISDYLDLEDNTIELGLTPNRSDCLSIAGVAREVAVLNQLSVNTVTIDTPLATLSEQLAVSIYAPESCPRYVSRIIRNIDIQQDTPIWMQERLRRSDIRPISVVVDIVNYVMLELGQPMHAFDLDTLQGGIQVRYAKAGELLVLLNNQTITLTEEDLVIADDKNALALAGIMGGAASAVNDKTQHIVLESAYFVPEKMAGKARSYGLHTDSSHRFERGVSIDLQEQAIDRVTQLLVDIVGGDVGKSKLLEYQEYLPENKTLFLAKDKVQRYLGMILADQQIEDILTGLSMDVVEVANGWRVIPPVFRFDIKYDVDLIEEICRIYGYDNIPSQQPLTHMQMPTLSETVVPESYYQQMLLAMGYQEAISYSFVAPELMQKFMPDTKSIKLANPISEDMSVMRTSLLPGLFTAIQYNLNRQQNRIRLFETGLCFIPDENGKLLQEKKLSGMICGAISPEQWAVSSREVDFFDIKADVEALLGGKTVTFNTATHPALHPGQCAKIKAGDTLVGYVGALHPDLLQQFGIKNKILAFELSWATLVSKTIPVFQPLSKYPAIRRDIAIVVDNAIPVMDIMQQVQDTAGDVLQHIDLFDIYQGAGITEGEKSIALGLVLQKITETLTDEQVDSIIGNIIKVLQTEYNAILRE